MTTIIAIVLVIATIVAFVFITKGKQASSAPAYDLRPEFLSRAERSFFGVLNQAIGTNGLIFAKIRVADVITPRKTGNKSEWQRNFNAISAKHFDFLVCDPDDCSVKAAIELDDVSHKSDKSKRRDALLNDACESAKLPLIRFKAKKGYVLDEVRQSVMAVLAPQVFMVATDTPGQPVSSLNAAEKTSEKLTVTDDTSTLLGEVTPSETADSQPSQPACPKCGNPMELRQAKSGANVGRRFWGCSTFPKCRGTLEVTN